MGVVSDLPPRTRIYLLGGLEVSVVGLRDTFRSPLSPLAVAAEHRTVTTTALLDAVGERLDDASQQRVGRETASLDLDDAVEVALVGDG